MKFCFLSKPNIIRNLKYIKTNLLHRDLKFIYSLKHITTSLGPTL